MQMLESMVKSNLLMNKVKQLVATIAVQIKSGASYLIDSGEAWKFYPSAKHQDYWEMYPLPVVLMLHDPDTDIVYWSDVTLQLRSDQKKRSPVFVQKSWRSQQWIQLGRCSIAAVLLARGFFQFMMRYGLYLPRNVKTLASRFLISLFFLKA